MSNPEMILLYGYGRPRALMAHRGFDRDPVSGRRLVGVLAAGCELRMYWEHPDPVKGSEFYYNCSTHVTPEQTEGLAGVYHEDEVISPSSLANSLATGFTHMSVAASAAQAQLAKLAEDVARAVGPLAESESLTKKPVTAAKVARKTVKTVKTVKVVAIKDRRKLALDKDI